MKKIIAMAAFIAAPFMFAQQKPTTTQVKSESLSSVKALETSQQMKSDKNVKAQQTESKTDNLHRVSRGDEPTAQEVGKGSAVTKERNEKDEKILKERLEKRRKMMEADKKKAPQASSLKEIEVKKQ